MFINLPIHTGIAPKFVMVGWLLFNISTPAGKVCHQSLSRTRKRCRVLLIFARELWTSVEASMRLPALDSEHRQLCARSELVLAGVAADPQPTSINDSFKSGLRTLTFGSRVRAITSDSEIKGLNNNLHTIFQPRPRWNENEDSLISH